MSRHSLHQIHTHVKMWLWAAHTRGIQHHTSARHDVCVWDVERGQFQVGAELFRPDHKPTAPLAKPPLHENPRVSRMLPFQAATQKST